MRTYWNENVGSFAGTVLDEPEFSHENHGEDYFRLPLQVLRLSGAEDILPVLVSRTQLEQLPVHPETGWGWRGKSAPLTTAPAAAAGWCSRFLPGRLPPAEGGGLEPGGAGRGAVQKAGVPPHAAGAGNL